MTTPPTVVFLDRDGTIIHDVAYLSRAEQVELLPGAADSVIATIGTSSTSMGFTSGCEAPGGATSMFDMILS